MFQEAKEISVTQVNTFSKPVVIKCKEVNNFMDDYMCFIFSFFFLFFAPFRRGKRGLSLGRLQLLFSHCHLAIHLHFVVTNLVEVYSQAIGKRLRAINESRAQKRKVIKLCCCSFVGCFLLFDEVLAHFYACSCVLCMFLVISTGWSSLW